MCPCSRVTCRDAGQVLQGLGAQRFYVGLGSPYYPSDDLRAQFNPRNLACSPQQVWDAFVEEYRRGLRRVLLSPRGLAFWRPLRGLPDRATMQTLCFRATACAPIAATASCLLRCWRRQQAEFTKGRLRGRIRALCFVLGAKWFRQR